jgi:hypothetical protein
MTKVYEGSFRIFLKWLEWMQRALHEQGTPYKPGDGGPIDIIGKAISALHDLKREPLSTNVPDI